MHRKANKRQKIVVSTQRELAKLLGVSADRVKQYIAQGMPGAPGAYCVDDCSEWVSANINRSRQKILPGTDADPLLSAGDSPALERYREERAKLARLDRLERERQLIRRDAVHEMLGQFASIMRGAGEILQRQFGSDALTILEEALGDVERNAEPIFRDDASDLYGPDAGGNPMVSETVQDATFADDA